MPWFDDLIQGVNDLIEAVQGRRAAVTQQLEALDEDTQRLLVLEAARRWSPDSVDELRKAQPTLAKLSGEVRDSAWLALFLCWTVFIPVIVAIWAVGRLRLLRLLRRNWQELLDHPDPQCEFWVVEGSVRRVMKSLPRKYRGDIRVVDRELKRLAKFFKDSRKRLSAVQTGIGSQSVSLLSGRREQLAIRLELESDPVVVQSLERQIRDLDGQLSNSQSLASAEARIQASQSEAIQSLKNLRSQLALLAADSITATSTVVPESVTRLQEMNSRLEYTQEAVEEVLRLGRY